MRPVSWPPPDVLTVDWLLTAGVEINHRYPPHQYAGDLLIAALRELATGAVQGRLCWCPMPATPPGEPVEGSDATAYTDPPVHSLKCEQLYRAFRQGRGAGFDMGPPAPVLVLQDDALLARAAHQESEA